MSLPPQTTAADWYDDPDGVVELSELAPEVIATVRQWLDEAASTTAERSAGRLAMMLKDPQGLPFTVAFIDGVIRPEDRGVAARNLAELARRVPRFLPWHLRVAVRLGGAASRVAPGLVLPVVRRTLRSMVGHLIVDARDHRLARTLRQLRADGTRLNLNLLGEAVLGDREAARRLDGTHRLLARQDVDYVSIKVSSTAAPHAPWAFNEAVGHLAEKLTPLFRQAAATTPHTFINLDMEEYRDLDLTVAVFTRILEQPELADLEAGIVLQAYLPDALQAMVDLQEWARSRRDRGGAPIKVRLVKGANLPMERVDADLHLWPLATWHSKQETDTNYKRLLDYALHPSRTRNVRLGVAGHNLFDTSFAWLLAHRRGVSDAVEFEMLLGMAPAQAAAVRRAVGGLLLYTPVVHPQEFDVAIAYLVRRLEEGASHDNFMSAVFELHTDEALFDRERDRFLASLRAVDRRIPAPHRVQDRTRPVEDQPMLGFNNVADTDPAVKVNAMWARAILEKVPGSRAGMDLVRTSTLTDASEVDGALAAAVGASPSWGGLSGSDRSTILKSAANALERRRAELIEVMASECGKTLDQADPEVSEAIDFANYYGERAAELDTIDGAIAKPVELTVVTSPWNFPVAIPAGSTLAALAAGSPVIVKPAPQARRCGAVMVEALWEAGVPRDVLQLVQVDDGELGQQLVSDPRLSRLILTGGYETAELFRGFRYDLPLLAETSGKNAIVVTPSADLDLAVKDIVQSAFGHAGQKCSAASLAILVGSVATSPRFRDQLADAVASLKVGLPSDPTTQMGPLIEPASGKLLDALTRLSPGERWVVEPRCLDEDSRLWSPGVKEGVIPGSVYHLTECFGPVLGIMTAPTLDVAIELQNQVVFGLTAGLHSLDEDEVRLWVDRVEAGNLYVNKGTTGAVVRRQPFGGWKRSAVGAGAKAGGPNYIMMLSDWTPGRASSDESIPPVTAGLLEAARTSGEIDVECLERSLRSDARAWIEEFGTVRDATGLLSERNLFRYRPHPVTVRSSSGAATEVVRVAAAGILAGAPVTVSTAVPFPNPLADALRDAGAVLIVEDAAAWMARLRTLGATRVRVVGPGAEVVHEAVEGKPSIAVYAQPVTEAGRLELLPFLKEQSISITAHRFGSQTAWSGRVLPDPNPVKTQHQWPA